MNKKIMTTEEFLDNLSPEGLKIAKELRSLVFKTLPGAEEKIMWSVPWYQLNKKSVAYISSSSNHVNFGFAFGARLHSQLLEGTGKNMRHIKIPHGAEIPTAELTKLLKEAAKL